MFDVQPPAWKLTACTGAIVEQVKAFRIKVQCLTCSLPHGGVRHSGLALSIPPGVCKGGETRLPGTRTLTGFALRGPPGGLQTMANETPRRA